MEEILKAVDDRIMPLAQADIAQDERQRRLFRPVSLRDVCVV